jgi:hypothetical protein
MAMRAASGAIGRRLVQIFYQTNIGKFLLLSSEIETLTLAVLLFYLEHLPLSKTGKSNTFNQWETMNATWNSVKQIPIGQRVLENSKRKLEARCQHEAFFQKKRGPESDKYR